MIYILFLIGIGGGFLSGLLGLGGAVIMIPLTLLLPPLFVAGALSMKAISGLSMLQVLGSSASGLMVHHKNKFIHYQTLVMVGVPTAVFSFAGSYLSKYMESLELLVIFGGVVLLSLLMLLLDKKSHARNHEEFVLHKVVAVVIGSIIGLLSGTVGIGGGFLLLPVMMLLLKMPVKMAMATSLGIVFLGAITGSIGKIMTLQVDMPLALAIITGSVPASHLGAKLHKALHPRTLKTLLVCALLFASVLVSYETKNIWQTTDANIFTQIPGPEKQIDN